MEKSNKYEAGVQFAKAQRANDAKKATSEYETAARALRLARDAAAPPQPPAAPKRRGKAKGTSGTLSDWLDGQAKEGRGG